MSFLVLFAFVILFLGLCFLRTHMKAWKWSRMDFDDLLGSVKPVPLTGISTLALDYLVPVKGQLRIDPAVFLTMIGGEESVWWMYKNAEVLIALAGYAHRWNPEESVIVVERMRRDGMTLRRAAFKLRTSFFARRGGVLVPFDVQELAGSYFLMRGRLLALYETSHVGKYPSLVAVL